MKTIFILFACMLVFSCTSPPLKDQAKESQCTEYACPMHPDKTSAKPGECPECHMEMAPVKEKQGKDTANTENAGKKE